MRYSPLSADEIGLFRQRLLFILGALGLILVIFIFRLWQLQVLNGAYYEEVAKGNRIRVVPQGGPRGIIYDREGEILAFNRPSFDIQLILEDTPNLERTLDNLSTATGVQVEEFRSTVRANRDRFGFKPIALMRDVGRTLADVVDTYQEDMPGISVSVEPKRLYPAAYLTSHVVGYVGVITEDQLIQLPLDMLRSGRVVGQAGLELMQNQVLIGKDGGKQVEVDHLGRELRILSRPVNPVPGMDIHLSLHLPLQRYVRQQMGGRKGVIIVSKPRTGEILSLFSYPDFDPNLFVGGIEDDSWRRLTTGEDKPLMDKAVQGVYPPGSVFKMVLAAAALNEGLIEPLTTLNCPGYYRIGREVRYCWKRTGHGDVNVAQAIEQSCNVFFYQLGLMLGVDKIEEYARMFGFGQPTGIELDSEKSGLIPSQAWKLRVLKERWYDGETLPVAIGQGYVSVTPLQLSAYLNIIANGGLWVRPTILRKIITPDGEPYLDDDLPREARLLPIPLEHFDVIRQGMVMAVNGQGTARSARSRFFTVAGKTGTSQIVGRKGKAKANEDELDESLLAHSLFVGYAPAEDPKVSIVVLVEHGRSGGAVAAPLARDILEFYHRNVEALESRFPEIQLPNTASARFSRELAVAFAPGSLATAHLATAHLASPGGDQ